MQPTAVAWSSAQIWYSPLANARSLLFQPNWKCTPNLRNGIRSMWRECSCTTSTRQPISQTMWHCCSWTARPLRVRCRSIIIKHSHSIVRQISSMDRFVVHINSHVEWGLILALTSTEKPSLHSTHAALEFCKPLYNVNVTSCANYTITPFGKCDVSYTSQTSK